MYCEPMSTSHENRVPEAPIHEPGRSGNHAPFVASEEVLPERSKDFIIPIRQRVSRVNTHFMAKKGCRGHKKYTGQDQWSCQVGSLCRYREQESYAIVPMS